jgi:hypothetical protein
MGVTSGGLLVNQYQVITITVPLVDDVDAADKIGKDLQAVIDWFNSENKPNSLEVVSVQGQ